MPFAGDNMVVLWTAADDSGSSAVTACISMASVGFQVGHLAGDDSHGGPCLHNVEFANC